MPEEPWRRAALGDRRLTGPMQSDAGQALEGGANGTRGRSPVRSKKRRWRARRRPRCRLSDPGEQPRDLVGHGYWRRVARREVMPLPTCLAPCPAPARWPMALPPVRRCPRRSNPPAGMAVPAPGTPPEREAAPVAVTRALRVRQCLGRGVVAVPEKTKSAARSTADRRQALNKGLRNAATPLGKHDDILVS